MVRHWSLDLTCLTATPCLLISSLAISLHRLALLCSAQNCRLPVAFPGRKVTFKSKQPKNSLENLPLFLVEHKEKHSKAQKNLFNYRSDCVAPRQLRQIAFFIVCETVFKRAICINLNVSSRENELRCAHCRDPDSGRVHTGCTHCTSRAVALFSAAEGATTQPV